MTTVTAGEPRWVDVAAPGVELKALSWGKPGAPVALCLHGFPDTAYSWRKLAARLVPAGWRVVAPFLRGYAPSSIPTDHSYHLGALMDDALRVHAAVGGDERDVVIGHDWGALTAAALAADADTPFARAVLMSVPPYPVLFPDHLTDRLRLLPQLPAQLLRSWYVGFLGLPGMAQRSTSWLVPQLWRQWAPGYDAATDLRHVDASIGTPESWAAAIGPYRALLVDSAPPARYARLHECRRRPPALPSLYLHGSDDRCVAPELAHRTERVLPPGSQTVLISGAGHFLQLERPDEVGDLVLGFIGR